MTSRKTTSLTLKRAYEAPSADDGMRILVDRLWPRGVAKAKAKIDLWLRDIAPSDGLRKRFHDKPEHWDAFCASYFAELEGEIPGAAAKELRRCMRNGPVTLIYAAHDERHNNAVALKIWLGRRKGNKADAERGPPGRRRTRATLSSESRAAGRRDR
jgi:uncharacterized protein YeaO (DUF488 family)